MEQNAHTPLEDFAAVIKDLTVLAEQIARLEDAKARAASEKRHGLLDGYIQEEQACILKLRGLEQHRVRLAGILGWDSLTFRQILEKAAPEQGEVLSPLFTRLESSLNRLQGARRSAEQIIKVRLHEIETVLARQAGGSYDNSRNVNVSSPMHLKMKDTYV